MPVITAQLKKQLLDDIEAATGKRLLSLTPKQFSQLTGISTYMVQTLCARGDLPAAQMGGKYSPYRIPYTALAPILYPH